MRKLPLTRDGWLGRLVVSAATTAVVVGCGASGGAPTLAASAGRPTPASTAGTVQAQDHEGPFLLTFDLPTGTWRTDEAISGSAELSLASGAAVDIGGSGSGVIGFDFEEVNGSRRMDAAFRMDCAPYHLVAAQPITTPIVKSVGFDASDPNAAFYQAWYSEPGVHLPAGTWTIRAVTSFVDGTGCSGASHDLRAPVVVTVLPADGSPPPSPTR